MMTIVIQLQSMGCYSGPTRIKKDGIYRDKNSAILELRSIPVVVGRETGIIVVVALTKGVERTDDRTMQLRVADPSFPALSRAVTRIMKVPETSEGTVSV